MLPTPRPKSLLAGLRVTAKTIWFLIKVFLLVLAVALFASACLYDACRNVFQYLTTDSVRESLLASYKEHRPTYPRAYPSYYDMN